jgi:alanyl-tRNA synthetase
MNAKELMNKYFEFFKGKEHNLIPSSSLVPINDSSVLFITAGMQPLISYFTGVAHPKGKRLVNVQKCMRTVDFENIGDNTHHTFFQMLGNWSLGDYFKKEAIDWSFEFLTKELKLPLEKLAFTVYKGDEGIDKDTESANIWKNFGICEKRIAYLGDDNFWIAGDSGPCGPSTEMFYWTGEENAPETFDPENEKWVEIWNDVFIMYNKKEDGTLEPLKQKNVDTGMGLERTLAVLSGKKSAYETDLFTPIIEKIEKVSGKKYEQHTKEMRIIADHIRAATFILGDDNKIVPSNVDRGYILRRLIRRTIRYGKMIGFTTSFVNLAKIVITIYSKMYPELQTHEEFILKEIVKEEEKFKITLEKGIREFAKMSQNKSINGKDAFLLFQSYGFPLEMTEEMADEKKITVDTEGFFAEFEKHQALSKSGAEKKFTGGLADLSGDTIKLHTATHLLNEALRKVISKNIIQKGSNITQERLRFDFNFERKLTAEEKQAVEDEVNRVIKLGLEVIHKEMPIKEAESLGAQKEFGAKYGDTVSVYCIGDYSKEFCGGPHVKNTKDLGHFKIIKEQSSAAGIRRIKAIVENK